MLILQQHPKNNHLVGGALARKAIHNCHQQRIEPSSTKFTVYHSSEEQTTVSILPPKMFAAAEIWLWRNESMPNRGGRRPGAGRPKKSKDTRGDNMGTGKKGVERG